MKNITTPVAKKITDPIAWYKGLIVFAVAEVGGSAIWKMSPDSGAEKLTTLPVAVAALSGFDVSDKAVWWTVGNEIQHFDFSTRRLSSTQLLDAKGGEISTVEFSKKIIAGFPGFPLLFVGLHEETGDVAFFFRDGDAHPFRLAGWRKQLWKGQQIHAINVVADRSGHLMLTIHSFKIGTGTGFVHVLYEIVGGKLTMLWQSGFIANIDLPVGIPVSQNFLKRFYSLSSQGLNLYINTFLPFQTLLKQEPENFPMRGITGDGKGNFWFATDVRGLFRWDSQTDELQKIQLNDFGGVLDSLYCYQKDLYLDKEGSLWTCNSSLGFFKIDTATLRSEFFPVGRVRTFMYSDGKIWYASEENLLMCLDPETGIITHVVNEQIPAAARGSTYIHKLAAGGKSGNLLLCSSEGLMEFEPSTKKTRWFRTDLLPGKNLPTHHFLSVWEDESGKWWLGTNENGLLHFDPATGSCQVFNTESGLCNNRVVSIQPDGQGRLWLGTFNGLSCFNPAERLFENFTVQDGLTSNEFNRLSNYISEDGRLFFGTINGVNIFNPEEALQARAVPGTYPLLTELQYYDKNSTKVTIHFWDGKTVQLQPGNRNLALEISAAFAPTESRLRFAYLLEGFSTDWVYLKEGQQTLQFDYLPDGKFNLRIKCTNGMGQWSEKELVVPIRVKAFFYKTWWFLALIAGSVFFTAFWFYRIYAKQKLASQKTIYLQELDQLKSRLFASITHEFRTPLTLILAPVRKLLRKPDKVSTGELVAGLRLVESNSERLLGLVNQILDLQKLEARQLQVQMEQDDVMALLRYLTDSFHSLAESKEISLEFHCQPASLFMDFDRDKLMKILGNLLSNALKFTPAGGRVSLSARENGTGAADKAESWLLIQVSDNGTGIPKEKLPKIFELFYQADNSSTRQSEGTGIGLTLAKELVELLGGSIGVESEQGKGSTFQVRLPVRREAQLASPSNPLKEEHARQHNQLRYNNLQPSETDSGSSLSTSPHAAYAGNSEGPGGITPLILIIEDNPDVAHFIASCLSDSYRIELAPDGEAGIGRALELTPDLVISDVMMPKADGFEVCRFLKNDARTSHIPIILLTALAEVKHRVEGLRRGADAYLAKPFYEEELFITMEKLLRLRQVLQARYAGLNLSEKAVETNNGVEVSTPSAPQPGNFDFPLEDAFMSKVLAIVHAHLDNPDFSVELLNREMSMSNTQLFQKLKALTNLSANQLIRKVRIEKAKDLLRHTELNISEIAYQTGFADPAYFTRIFTREEGIAPSEFKNR